MKCECGSDWNEFGVCKDHKEKIMSDKNSESFEFLRRYLKGQQYLSGQRRDRVQYCDDSEALASLEDIKQKLQAAEEEIFLLRMIAYAYKNLDCHSSPEAIEAITVKGWQAQLNYEKWWLNNKGDVHFKDWKELEQALEKIRGGE